MFNTRKELEIMVLNAIGLYNKNGILFDQDFNVPLLFEGRSIRIINDTGIIHRTDIRFDIFNNKKLCEFLLKVLFVKEQEENDIYIQTYYEVPNRRDPGKTSLEIIIDKEKMRTKYYYNECLKYIDMILRVTSFNDIDLSNFDIIEE